MPRTTPVVHVYPLRSAHGRPERASRCQSRGQGPQRLWRGRHYLGAERISAFGIVRTEPDATADRDLRLDHAAQKPLVGFVVVEPLEQDTKAVPRGPQDGWCCH